MAKKKSSALSSARGSRDPIGQAIKLFWKHSCQDSFEAAQAVGYEIEVFADKLDKDVIPVAHLFRIFDDMPLLEQKALELTSGRVLDVGAAAGCHSLYLKEKGIEVEAIDISPGAVEVMCERGLNAKVVDLHSFKPESKFDTVLVLMNGIGLAGTEAHLPKLLQHLKTMLKADGQILIDSSDLGEYADDFAEVNYQMHFKNAKSRKFPWLFLPYSKFELCAVEQGFDVSQIYSDKDGSYLARLVQRL